MSTPLTQHAFDYIIDPIAPVLLEIDLPVYETVPNCSNLFSYTLMGDTPFTSIASTKIRVQTGDLLFLGSFEFTVIATETPSGKTNNSQEFTI